MRKKTNATQMNKTWEETIQHIRSRQEFAALVHDAYLGADLKDNVERFRQGEEFIASQEILRPWLKHKSHIADIGSGNGISAIAFAMLGHQVSSIEPDPSDTIGAGAQKWLAGEYGLHNFQVFECFGEALPLPDEAFDVVYIRQAMHHAHDLRKFIAEAARLLKKGGVLFTVRDHVVFDEADKQHFLNEHPLHKYYGGENAFTPAEYREAIAAAGLSLIREFRYYDTPVNYAPATSKELEAKAASIIRQRKTALKSKLGPLAALPFVFDMYNRLLEKRGFPVLDERMVAGRPYSYLARK
jgi:SAM-dependent methyltransferase